MPERRSPSKPANLPRDPAFEAAAAEHPARVRAEYESSLAKLVEVPTISSDPERRDDIRRGARLAVEVLEAFGARAEIVETDGHPLILGELPPIEGAPWVTVYNHLDVQPANPAEWDHPPFTFRKEGDRYLGRGTTDDKGPAVTALAAARFCRDQHVPINIRFLWEMEEEIGSPSFAAALKQLRPRLRTASILVSDTIWVSAGKPAIDYGLRGLLGVLLRLRTGTKDVHSGLAGGAARNPIAELVHVLDRCVDARTGRVRIPGFYDAVRRPTQAEMKDFLASGFSVSKFKAAHGLKSLRSNDAATVLKSIWAMPTFELHGITGGYTGPGIMTIVPPAAEAKLSMRLVPDQDPKEIFDQVRRFVRQINPDVEVVRSHQLEPYLGPSSGPLADAAAEAVHLGFGKRPAFVREGGSIGAVLTMHKLLKAPVLLLGLSLPEHSYHGPNEFFDWGQASGGMTTFAHYFRFLSGLKSARFTGD